MLSIARRTLLGLAAALALTVSADAATGRVQSGAESASARGEILWDRYGVPHIYAKTEAGAFYGFGWAQAHSHANTLLKIYGESRGRAAEYWGKDYEAGDRWIVANDVPARSRVWYGRQTRQMRANLDAFAQGVNDYAVRNPDAVTAEMQRVLPLSGLDVIQHAHRLMNYHYIASERRVMADPNANDAGGSNAWAIAPSKSASGKAMLLANPHLPWAPGMLTYYEAHINAPGLSVYGATQVGLPVLRFAFNDDLGFTNTVNTILGFTSYQLKLAPGGYMFDGKVLPFKTVPMSYKVRQPDGTLKTVAFEQKVAVQGPVFDLPGGRGTIALKVAGLDRPGVLQQYLDMGKARSWAAFEKALKTLQVPMFNIVYADRAGHIMYLHNGILPKHKDGDFARWSRPVPGDTSATLWTKIHSYEDLPKVVDPASGFVQNANDPPWVSTWPRTLDPAKYPAYTAQIGPMSQRAQLSTTMIADAAKVSFDDFVTKKIETRAVMADRLLPELFNAAAQTDDADIRAAVGVLFAWDRRFEADSRGALLFETWAGLFAPNNFTSQTNYAVKWTLDDPLNTPRGIVDPAAAVAMLKTAAAKTRELYGAIDRPFGEVSRFKVGDVSTPGNGGFGNMGIFRVSTWGPLRGGVRSPVHGETWVSMVEFGTPMRAVGVMSYGNSSQPGSPHRTDQLPFLTSKTFRTLWRTRAEVEANVQSRTAF
jgi:acyl-homoserine-lactone acylase